MANKFEQIVTDIGIARYPWLNYPDDQYSNPGEYKLGLILTKEQAAPLIKKIEDTVAKAKELGKGKKVSPNNLPYKDELDDQEQPTGNFIFNFKQKSKINMKDGSQVDIKPVVVDSKGRKLTNEQIWGGTKCKVSALLIPYLAGSNYGCTMRLRAVQIIELVSGKDGDMGSHGFKEEKGYEAPDTDSTTEEDKVSEETDDF
tara:strand:- start:496 stop:1098 length:603 start_codon:yes stop_codon:yes gene_type:complete